MADAAAEIEEGGMVRTLKDLFAGAAGGIAQVLLGEFVFGSGWFLEFNCWSFFLFGCFEEWGRVTCRGGVGELFP